MPPRAGFFADGKRLRSMCGTVWEYPFEDLALVWMSKINCSHSDRRQSCAGRARNYHRPHCPEGQRRANRLSPGKSRYNGGVVKNDRSAAFFFFHLTIGTL